MSNRVLHYYGRYLEGPSGVTESLDSWAKLAQANGFEVEVISAESSNHRISAESPIPVCTVLHVGKGRVWRLPVGLWQKVRRGDILYLHEGWINGNLCAALMGRLRGGRVVLMPHGAYAPAIVARTRDPFGARRLVERAILRLVNAVHVFYATETGEVERIAGTRLKVWVLPNGTILVPRENRWVGGGSYALFLGRLDVEGKGLDRLLATWRDIPDDGPALIIAGPDYSGGRAVISQLIEKYELSGKVLLPGLVSGDRKMQLLRECDIYVHPSRWESCSVAVLEALAAGAPVSLAAEVHAAPELSRAGVVTPVNFERPEEAASLIMKNCNEKDLAHRALTWSQRAGTWDSMGLQYQSLIVGLNDCGGTSQQ